MHNIWRNEHADWKTKKRLYVTYIQSTVLHGCEAWVMDEKTEKALNSFNSKCLAVLTGRSIREEATDPSHNMVAAAFERRRRWVGHVLRMDDGRLAKQTLKATFNEDKEVMSSLVGRLVNGRDCTWEDLEEMAEDRSEWRKESKKVTKELVTQNRKGTVRRNPSRRCKE